jgi:hypothetical protein
VPRWENVPQAHSRVSNINFDICPGNTFNLIPKWARTLLSLIYFSWDIYRDSLAHFFSNIKVDIWHPAVGLRCIFSPRHLRHLKTLKCLGGKMHLKPTTGCQISTLMFEKKCGRGTPINIPWKKYQGRQSSCLHLAKLKYQNWYLIPCCGLEVHYTT